MAKSKPTKPYPLFPLTAHPNGQWCKKIRGKIHFFGVWADPQSALQKYLTQAADLHAGRQPRLSMVAGDGLTIKDVCNHFLCRQKDKWDARAIVARTFDDYKAILSEFAETMDKLRLVGDLRPEDFQRYRSRLAKKLGTYALTRHIVVIRSVFKYAFETDLIDRTMKFGTGFSVPSATLKRKEKNKNELENGVRLFSCQEVRALLRQCEGPLRAAVLLGINGGFGNTDCALLPQSALHLDRGLIDYCRPKTGIQRVVPLWPETVEALKTVLTKDRPKPIDAGAEPLVFLSPTGRPLVRQVVSRYEETEDKELKITNVDGFVHAVRDLLKALNIYRRGLGFYTLRHTFRTWADETKDQHAVYRIMGHALPGMSGVYVERIELDRLRAVIDYVRDKLFATE